MCIEYVLKKPTKLKTKKHIPNISKFHLDYKNQKKEEREGSAVVEESKVFYKTHIPWGGIIFKFI